MIPTNPGHPPASTSPRDTGLRGEMGDGITPRRSPPGYPVNSPQATAIACPPPGVLPIPSRRTNGHHGNPKWEGDGGVTPPGHILPPPWCQDGMWPHCQGCTWGPKDASGDGREEDAYFWHSWVAAEAGWVLSHPRSGSPSHPPPVLRVPPSPRPCPWGAQRFLLVNRMFFSAHPPTTLACSLASVSWYGRLRGTQGGR